MKALPWWLKWLVLPVIALFLLGALVVWLIGMVIHALLYVAVGAIIVVALMWSGRRIRDALTGGRRRRRRQVEADASSRWTSGRRGVAQPEPGSADYMRQFRDLL